MMIKYYTHYSLEQSTWEGIEGCKGLGCSWLWDTGITKDYLPLIHPQQRQNSSLQVPLSLR